MSDDQTDSLMTKEEALERARVLATPIDFENLIANGVLEKKGKGYKVLDMSRLPEHAKSKITEISGDTVKFDNATKAAQKIVDKLSKIKP